MKKFDKHYDLIVVGAGLSGVCAAVRASREGLSVLLAEKSGAPGGALTNNLVYPFMRYWTTIPESGERKYLSAGIFTEMRVLEKKYCPRENEKHFNPEYYKLILDELLTSAGVEVLYHAALSVAEYDGRRISSVHLSTLAGDIEVSADTFCDCTGDGQLFYLAGCDYQLGRESDGLCQPMTTCFRISGVDLDVLKKDIPMLQEKYREEQASGNILNPRENLLVFYGIGEGILHLNTTRIVRLDPTDPFDVSRAEVEARRQIYELECFLKKYSAAFAQSTVISIANEIGVRESRKLRGRYILTVNDLKSLTKFEDGIALGNYDVDIHNPEGSGTSHYYFKDGDYYTIPYRSLLACEYDNLLVAGRCISATHEAQASIRIMPICATLGEAAGMAAAVARESGVCVASADTGLIRNRLRACGAAID